MAILPQVYVSRQAEILTQFQQVLESHLDGFLAGRVEKMYELHEIAALLCLHPGHLNKLTKLATTRATSTSKKILVKAKKI